MVRWSSRRGANAAEAAILVAIIAALLVAYILFLPPAEREALLFSSGNGGSYGSGGQGTITQYGPILVFKDTPGTLLKLASPVSEHNIPSMTVYTQINTQVVKRIDSAYIKNGVFANQVATIEFPAERMGSKNFLLSFGVNQAAVSPLRVLLNGHLIYERPVSERSPAPIQLPTDYLVDGTNNLQIESTSSGLAFWRSNSYALHNIQITADVLDVSNAQSSATFSLPEKELRNIESVHLQFVPECDPRKAGRLTVLLNSHTIRNPDNSTQEVPNMVYSGLPDCGVLFKTDVSESFLQPTNNVVFASAGQFVLDRIKLVVRLRQDDYPVYYFNIPKDMFDSIDQGHAQLRLTMTFTDYRVVKTGEVVINGFVQSFSTKDYAYQAVIDPGIINPGPNTVMAAPHVDKLDIAEIKIELI